MRVHEVGAGAGDGAGEGEGAGAGAGDGRGAGGGTGAGAGADDVPPPAVSASALPPPQALSVASAAHVARMLNHGVCLDPPTVFAWLHSLFMPIEHAACVPMPDRAASQGRVNWEL